MFEAHAATLVAAADALSRLSDDDSSTKEQLKIINDREHDADDIIREVLTTVRRTFPEQFAAYRGTCRKDLRARYPKHNWYTL